MGEAAPVSSENHRPLRPVFVSYATADRRQALALCKAIEKRGTDCWISTRDVAPGENYQEAIVRSIRDARAMVLVFSSAANDSDEIKKEMSLASRYRVPVIALRLENVEPSDAFAYELSTRQWIDAFEGRDKAVDSLVTRIGQLPADGGQTSDSRATPSPLMKWRPRTAYIVAGSTALALLLAVGVWFAFLRAPAAAAYPMQVRLSGFQLLSADLPATMRDAVNTEIIAAFNKDGVVGVSTASQPPPGQGPAFALGGTIQRDGGTIRVITQLTNERSGATLWSDTFNYPGTEGAAVPRHVAVDAGNVVRCGLFGASTYRKPLPDNVLKDYLQFCQGHWDPVLSEGRKALVPAQRVVAALPDFSWGWAAVTGAYWKVALTAENKQQADEARASGREAADRAIAIDPRNSEALYIKAVLLEPRDWLGREALFKRAVAARRLDCGCEHHQYGWLLAQVGRLADGIGELRAANDMLALYVYTPLTLANVMAAAGKPEEARPMFDAAIQLAPNSDFAKSLTADAADKTADLKAIADPATGISPAFRAALLAGYRAAASHDTAAKASAVRTLLALPPDDQKVTVAWLLADLGNETAAFDLAARLANQANRGPLVFWHPHMRRTLDDPRFPALARQLGLIDYWKKSRTRPDVCNTPGPPAFCREI